MARVHEDSEDSVSDTHSNARRHRDAPRAEAARPPPAGGGARTAHSVHGDTPGNSRGNVARRLFEDDGEDPLTAVKTMLNRPPGSMARGERTEAWFADMERLVNKAQANVQGGGAHDEPNPQPTRGDGGRNNPRVDATRGGRDARPQPEGSHSAHTPGNRDLRDKLKRKRRDGEDARVSIERNREREEEREAGREEEDGDASDASRDVNPRHRRRREETPPFDGGCAALSKRIRQAPWPTKFRPELPERYDGTAPPHEFLQIYSTAVRAAGGGEDVMAGYFHLALKGSARSWFMNLAPKSIGSWKKLCREFMANFQGTAKRPGNQIDLDRVVQEDGESLRAFMQRFSQVRNTIPRVDPSRSPRSATACATRTCSGNWGSSNPKLSPTCFA